MGAPSDGVGRSTKGGTGGGNDYNNYNKKKLDTNDNNDTNINASSTTTITTTCDVYLSLIQQYIGVFQIDNALFLSERCIADYPNCYEAIYLKALCYYRMNKIKNALACLNSKQIIQSDNHFTKTTSNFISTTATNTTSSTGNTNSSYSIGSSMLYLSAQCSYELGEYANAESTLLRNTRILYQQIQSSQQQQYTSMDDWIVQSTPCPIPNGAAGLALLGKICRKSNRKERAVQYFHMSLQLDPFLFTSFQALAELGDTTLDASSIFGGSVLKDITKELPGHTNYHPSSETTTIMNMKTPLQPMGATPLLTATSSTIPTRMGAARAIGFETPGLTPITHRNESFVTTRHNNGIPSLHNRSSVTPITNGAGATTHQQTKIHSTTTNETQVAVMRRAKQIVGRQYYPPSPDTNTTNASAIDIAPSSVSHSAATPVTSVTRSMRYLRGLGAVEGGGTTHGARSLFPSSISENQSSNSVINSLTNVKSNINNHITNHDTNNNDVNNKSKPESSEKDISVQEILNILTISGAAYQNICQYRCRDAIQLLQQLPISHQRTAWVLHQQGRAFLEQGDFMSAQRCFEYMHSIDPGRMQGLELLSTVYWQLKKEVDLANLAQRAMDWDYESPQAHCVSGNCFSLQKDQETALIFFKRSLHLDPNFTYVHTLSGYEYMANEDFSNAILCFRKALQLDDRHYNAWYGLGMIYHRQEKYDLAEYHFERAVNIHPTSGVLRCNLGMAQNANGKAYMALETLSEAFRLDPRNPQARFQRATIYSALHRPEEALAELKIVRDAAPREATVHFAMGKILKRLGRLDEAMKCFLTAMDLDPKDNQMIKSAMDKLGEPDGDEEGSTNY